MSGTIVLETAGLPQAPVIAALQRACFPDDPWDEGSIATLLGQPGCFAVLALDGAESEEGEPVGFVLARVAAEDAEILAIGVVPEARRSGAARRLVAAALDGSAGLGATAMFLEVAEDNGAARSLYKSCGFFSVGRRPGYYKRPDGRVAALVLRRPVQDSGPSILANE